MLVIGSNHGDHLLGTKYDDLIFAGSGSDGRRTRLSFDTNNPPAPGEYLNTGPSVKLLGGIFGGEGDDLIYGGSGRDTIFGGRGTDHLWGGSGRDQFVFLDKHDQADTIHDFSRGDRIDLSALAIGDDQWIGHHAFTGHAGDIRFAHDRLSIDFDGDGRADFRINIEGRDVHFTDLLL